VAASDWFVEVSVKFLIPDPVFWGHMKTIITSLIYKGFFYNKKRLGTGTKKLEMLVQRTCVSGQFN